MPTTIHDLFTQLVVQEIQSQLRAVADTDTNIATIIDSVQSEATSDVVLHGHRPIKGRYPKRSPDASFAHADSQYPSIIIETSYSQKRKHLAELAGDYIYGSNGNIAAIVGLDIAYRVRSKKASTSIWRPEIRPDPRRRGTILLRTTSVQEVEVVPPLTLTLSSDPRRGTANRGRYLQAFRDDNGTASLGLGLSLQLRDTAQETQLSTVVQISCGELCSFLRTAEIRDRMERMQQGVQAILRPDCRNRNLEVTPLKALRPKKRQACRGRNGRSGRSCNV